MRALLVALAVLAAPACASAQSARDAIVPDWHRAVTESFHYSAAVRAGDLIFLSGVVAGSREGETLEQSFDHAFATVGRVLEAADTDWDHVVEITTYHTDLPAQIEVFGAVRDRYVRAPYPAWTAIDIDRLYPDSGLVEIRIVARVRNAD